MLTAFAALAALAAVGGASPGSFPTPAPRPDAEICAPARVREAVEAAGKAMAARDAAAARTALGAAGFCPPADGASYVAHLLRADIASRAGDWVETRAALQGIRLHPETSASAPVELLRLAADQGLQDPAAFARDRAAVLAADDARLAAAGRRVETFRAGAASVTAYEAEVVQGPFRRELEFIAVPDDPSAYPVSVLLTDDVNVAAFAAARRPAPVGGAAPPVPAHAWFLDLYDCAAHHNVGSAGDVSGPRPDYAEVKARVLAVLGAWTWAPPPVPPAGGCPTARWILPGLGAPPAVPTAGG